MGGILRLQPATLPDATGEGTTAPDLKSDGENVSEVISYCTCAIRTKMVTLCMCMYVPVYSCLSAEEGGMWYLALCLSPLLAHKKVSIQALAESEHYLNTIGKCINCGRFQGCPEPGQVL